jgi:uridine kinase
MPHSDRISSPIDFSVRLYELMKLITPAVNGLELLEFQYCMENVTPKTGWQSIQVESKNDLEYMLNNIDFYKEIETSLREDGRIVLHPRVKWITQVLFKGLVDAIYTVDWVNRHFYFDVRGFFFLHRTEYITEGVLKHFRNGLLTQFEPEQKRFEPWQSVGYKEFRDANKEVDAQFIKIVGNLVASKKKPIVLAIAGPTAAGKTEIVERLSEVFLYGGDKIASIEIDNFLTDREYREAHGINSEGKEALHLDKLVSALEDITQGKKINIPRYDFVAATSSHDLEGKLKPRERMIGVEPADIIFIEGNFPFLIEEIEAFIDIKVVYLTGDAVRLKRKWKRDMDYRKKYDMNYFRNRYFKEQFIMAKMVYIPQMKVCDLLVDTTNASVWATPEISILLNTQ